MYNTSHLLLGYGYGPGVYTDNGEEPAELERHHLEWMFLFPHGIT